MGHTIKGQWPHQYRPSATRRASGLEPIKESIVNARKLWRKAIRRVKANLQINRNLLTKGTVIRGRFTVKNRTNAKSP